MRRQGRAGLHQPGSRGHDRYGRVGRHGPGSPGTDPVREPGPRARRAQAGVSRRRRGRPTGATVGVPTPRHGPRRPPRTGSNSGVTRHGRHESRPPVRPGASSKHEPSADPTDRDPVSGIGGVSRHRPRQAHSPTPAGRSHADGPGRHERRQPTHAGRRASGPAPLSPAGHQPASAASPDPTDSDGVSHRTAHAGRPRTRPRQPTLTAHAGVDRHGHGSRRSERPDRGRGAPRRPSGRRVTPCRSGPRGTLPRPPRPGRRPPRGPSDGPRPARRGARTEHGPAGRSPARSPRGARRPAR